MWSTEEIRELKENSDLRTIYPPELLVKQYSKYALAHCCFHEDRNASAILTKWSFECKAGCTEKLDIIAFVQRANACGFREAMDIIERKECVNPLPPPPPEKELEPLDVSLMKKFANSLNERTAKTLLAQGLTMAILGFYSIGWCNTDTNAYTIPMTEGGQLCNLKMYQTEPTKGFWWYGGGKRPQVQMYGFDKIPELGYNSDVLLIMEGQKDVWSAAQDGFNAVSLLDGAGTWRSEYARQVQDYGLIVPVGDNDPAGRKFVQQVCRDIRRAVPFDWRRLVPDAPDGFDYTNFVNNGGSHTDFKNIVWRW